MNERKIKILAFIISLFMIIGFCSITGIMAEFPIFDNFLVRISLIMFQIFTVWSLEEDLLRLLFFYEKNNNNNNRRTRASFKLYL